MNKLILLLTLSCSTYNFEALSRVEILPEDNPRCTYLGQVFSTEESIKDSYYSLKNEVIKKNGDSLFITSSTKNKKTFYVQSPGSTTYTNYPNSFGGISTYSDHTPGYFYPVEKSVHQYQAKAYRCKYATL